MSDPTETARRVLDLDKRRAELDALDVAVDLANAAPELARALVETQAALAAATEEQSRAWALLTGEKWTQTRAEGSLLAAAERAVAALAAANDTIEAFQSASGIVVGSEAVSDPGDVTPEHVERYVSALVAERDALHDAVVQANANLRNIFTWEIVGDNPAGELRWVVRHVVNEMRPTYALAGVSAAPAPTPAAVPGLVFGEPDEHAIRWAQASDKLWYAVQGRVWWCDKHVPDFPQPSTEAAIAAATAHNAARLKGGE